MKEKKGRKRERKGREGKTRKMKQQMMDNHSKEWDTQGEKANKGEGTPAGCLMQGANQNALISWKAGAFF